MGAPLSGRIQLDLNGLSADEITLELVVFKRLSEKEIEIRMCESLEFKEMSGHVAVFECRVAPGMAGVYEYGIRMVPKHVLLPHRMDFPLARWF